MDNSDAGIRKTELFRDLLGSDDYESDDAVVQLIRDMRQRVADGERPDDVLEEIGIEPDFIFDLF